MSQPTPSAQHGRRSSKHKAAAMAVGRQVKACNYCRVTKIKCKMSRGSPPCDRCEARGLSCLVEPNAQALLEESNQWKSSMHGRVAQLQTAVNILLRNAELPPLASYTATEEKEDEKMRETRDDTHEAGDDDSMPAVPITTPVAPVDDTVYGLPINSLYEVTRLPSLRAGGKSATRGDLVGKDFISRGLISEATAQQLLARFTSRLDFFCYGIMCPHESLESVRASSTLLTAAVCTVSALHDSQGAATFKACHTEFLRLLSAKMFSISHSKDDIRALIIGSYWLSNISYTLIGHAIRAAMRLNYHLSYFSAINGRGEDDTDKARLWYVLYIIDHHSSILYGRPAIISPAEEPHQQWETFIHSGQSCEIDLRMCSQVALYHITAKVKDVFGSYSVSPVPDHFLPQLKGYFSELDKWYMVWGNRMPRNAQIGWFARDGAILHYHFARLHLCSYVFRGLTENKVTNMSEQMRDYASLAVASAKAVLEIVLQREDMNRGLVGMPIYFHGMINFAAVFLLKAARTNFFGLTIADAPQVYSLVERCIHDMRAPGAAPQHLVYHLGNGLEEMMNVSKALTDVAQHMQDPVTAQHSPAPTLTMDSMFALNTFDLFQYPLESGIGVPMDDGWDAQGWGS